jgi:ribosomal protein S18 acetylase RimI-like enzyme
MIEHKDTNDMLIPEKIYTYRTMKIGDYDEIMSLWEHTPSMNLGTADSRQNIAVYLSHNRGQSFVCKANGNMVGTILCGNDGRNAYIHHTAVDTKHQKKGIATELVRMALDKQKELGIEKAALFIMNSNESGKDFWSKRGFILQDYSRIMAKII